jgi:hypothetical protein
MGLANAPAAFQRLVNDTLSPVLDQGVVAYLDDILVDSEGSREDHLKIVQQVLELLNEKGFRLNQKKTEIGVRQVDFLRATISKGEIRMDSTKVQAIEEWPLPKSLKEVQAFLGLTNYYRRFVEGYARLAEPLTNLL